MLGYIFFGITCLMYIVLTLICSSKAPVGREMSDEMALNALGIGFAISSLILTLSIWWKGGFDWVSQYSNLSLSLPG